MSRILILLISILMVQTAAAGDGKYPVREIPEHLLKNANMVKRVHETEFRIISTDETVLKERYAITILNENAFAYAGLTEYYSKLSQIKSIEGALYDASGNLVKKLKAKDVLDLSATDDISLVDDNRRKVHHFYFREYPYTVEYEVETKYNNTLFFPVWAPQDAQLLSVERSVCTIIYPAGYEVRHQAYNYNTAPEIITEKDKKMMKFEVKDLPAIKLAFASPSWRELTTMVYFAPSEFEIQGYKGNMTTWKDLGKFQKVLNEKRDELPDPVVKKVQQLTAGIQDDREKVRVLYHFLQKNTRYISIQLGLGGWQPFEASFVAQKGYGDCKALTNYMYSLLKVAGINSNFTLIYSGSGSGDDKRLIENFPSVQFNHVILCVPMQKDTMWLECTSQDAPPGYMGKFTGNRKALVIGEDGGTLVSTPRYTIKENLQLRNIHANLDEQGTLNVKVNTRYGGVQQDDLSWLINHLSKDKVKEYLQQELELSTYNINDFKYEETKDMMPELVENLDITVSNYATISGKRIFIVPNILNRNVTRFEADDKRKVDLVFGYEYRDVDEYEIEIPAGYELEALSPEVSIKSKFGNYTSSVKFNKNKISYKRVIEKYSGRFPASDQAELAKFYSDIFKADRSRIVLVKKEQTPSSATPKTF